MTSYHHKHLLKVQLVLFPVLNFLSANLHTRLHQPRDLGLRLLQKQYLLFLSLHLQWQPVGSSLHLYHQPIICLKLPLFLLAVYPNPNHLLLGPRLHQLHQVCTSPLPHLLCLAPHLNFHINTAALCLLLKYKAELPLLHHLQQLNLSNLIGFIRKEILLGNLSHT